MELRTLPTSEDCSPERCACCDCELMNVECVLYSVLLWSAYHERVLLYIYIVLFVSLQVEGQYGKRMTKRRRGNREHE